MYYINNQFVYKGKVLKWKYQYKQYIVAQQNTRYSIQS